MNQNYQAKKLLKRLQNNPIKNHVKFKKFPKSTRVAFSFWLLHSLVIVLVDALAQAYILGSADQYQNVVVLFAVTFCGLSQDQSWPLRFDNMELNSEKLTTTISTSLLTGKGLKSHSHIHCFFQMVSCVNLCYYVNLSSEDIQYQEQSKLASSRLVKSK